MDIQQARDNMVKQQLNTWEVMRTPLLHVLASTPREEFVPAAYRNLAFVDMALPLPHRQQMFTPKEEARVLQAINLERDEVVLEIGTGTGYLTALLAKLSAHVFTVDYYEDLILQAKKNLAKQSVDNVTFVTADAASGWHEQAPFDVIVVTGAWPIFPAKIKEDLKVGGRLFCICGKAPAMTATLVTRTGRSEWQHKSLFETVTPELIHAPEPVGFIF